MSFARLDKDTLVFQCDRCDETLTYKSGNFAECWKLALEDDWFTLKPAGYAWQHFCSVCRPAAEVEAKDRAEREQQRDRIRTQNGA